MKYLIIIIFLFSSLGITSDCGDAYDAADWAYTYAKRGYNSSNIDDLHYNARKAKNAADDAMSEADDCDCRYAYDAADWAYTYAKRAYNEDDLDDALEYMRKAKNAADDAMSEADDCD